jgi:hypothetical protein
MAAKRKPKLKKNPRNRTPTSDPVQSARFLEMAKKLEVDESGAAFERAMDAIVPRKK